MLALSASSVVYGQQDRGSIAGAVTDGNKAALEGAQVQIAPSAQTPSTGGSLSTPASQVADIKAASQTSTTDQQGSFILSGLLPGRYTLKVSYIGFQPYLAQVEVIGGKITNVSSVLTLPSTTESVEVRPEREVGEAESLNRQRVATNIVQILPSEVINSLPNVNIADAVGRMPSVSVERDEGESKYIQIRGTEPRLNNVTIDGIVVPSPENVRNVKLDTIPADLVESVEVNKTHTADMDGEGIGGSVNLTSRQATDAPYFAVEGLLGHTPISGGRGEDQVFATYGRRFLANKKLGLLVTGSYDWNGRGINDVEPAQAVNNIVDNTGNTIGTVNAPNSIDIRDYFYDRSRYGLGGTLDYKFNERASVYLKALYSYFDDFGEDSINRLNVGNFTSATTTDNSGNVQYQNVYRRPVQEIFSVSAGGQKDIGNATLNVRAALSQAKLTGGFTTSAFDGPAATTVTNPDQTSTTLQDGVGYNYSNKDIFLPKLTPVVTPGNVSIYDPTQYSLASISFQNDHTFERDAVGQADFAKRYSSASIFGTWQLGFKIRDVVKEQLYNQSQASGGTALLSNFVTDRGQGNSYYFGQYTAGPQSKATRIISYYNANQALFTVDPETASNLQNDFHVNERVYAGYLMNTATYKRFRLNTGLRIEGTTEGVLGYEPDSAGNVKPVTFNNSYTSVLPSVGLQYNLGDYTDFRFAYSIALSRPNYGDLAPYLAYDPTASNTAGNPALTGGNPDLKATWAHNLDLLGEHYFKNVGVVQGGVFYKQLYEYIATSVRNVSYSAPGATGPANYFETSPINTGEAHLIGVEASYEQHLTRLPGPLSGTGFRANYSYISSVVGYPGRNDHPTLQRTAPNNYNFDVTYDKYDISARLGITHNDAYLWSYAYQDGTPVDGAPTTPTPGGIKGPQSDTYIYPHTQVDAQVSYLVPRGRGLSIVAQFLNLNNEVFGFYNGSQQYPIQREYYSPTYTFGIRWTQSAERGSVFKQ